jgi:hypothetical protein
MYSAFISSRLICQCLTGPLLNWASAYATGLLLARRIYGNHVVEYMEYLEEDDEERYKKQFSTFIKAGITSDKVEDMYAEAHENPAAQLKEKKGKPAKPYRRLVALNKTSSRTRGAIWCWCLGLGQLCP